MTAVLHVVPSLDERMGGSVRAPLNVCLYLQQQGVDVTVAATTDPSDDVDYLDAEYASVPRVLHARGAPAHNFRSAPLHAWLRENVSRFDLVEINGIFTFPALYASWSCRRAGVPYVVRPHGQLEPYDLQKHAAAKQVFGRLFVRPLLAGSSRVVLTTERERAALQTFGASVATAVAPLPVQQPESLGDGATFRKMRGIPSDALVVLFLGRYDEKKGLDLLIPSVSRVRNDVPQVWFLLVGEGEPTYERTIEAMIDDQGMRDRTTVTGFLSGPEKAAAYAAANLFALPSRNENFGIVVVEAMYAGLALLLSNQVYTADLPAQTGAAVVCEPTKASCEAALRELLTNAPELAALGTRARATAQEHFSPETASRHLIEIYDAILEGHRSPTPSCEENVSP
jgi:glycosyltransferase involved in cell wall biosynthesis